MVGRGIVLPLVAAARWSAPRPATSPGCARPRLRPVVNPSSFCTTKAVLIELRLPFFFPPTSGRIGASYLQPRGPLSDQSWERRAACARPRRMLPSRTFPVDTHGYGRGGWRSCGRWRSQVVMQESLCTEAKRTLPSLRLLAVVAVQGSTPDARSPAWSPRPLLVFPAIRDSHT